MKKDRGAFSDFVDSFYDLQKNHKGYHRASTFKLYNNALDCGHTVQELDKACKTIFNLIGKREAHNELCQMRLL